MQLDITMQPLYVAKAWIPLLALVKGGLRQSIMIGSVKQWLRAIVIM